MLKQHNKEKADFAIQDAWMVKKIIIYYITTY